MRYFANPRMARTVVIVIIVIVMKMVLVVALLFLKYVSIFANGNIKITEGVDRSHNSGYLNQLPRVQADIFSGPWELYFLSRYCFKESFDRWEFEICPFQNVTQARINGVQTNLLGVWGHWNTPAVMDTTSYTASAPLYAEMVYVNGKECANEIAGEIKEDSSRRAVTHVSIRCGAEQGPVKLIAAEEHSNCVFNLTLGVPISCHLLEMR
jgi:hypothetical protein